MAALVGVCPHCGQRMLIRHGVKLSPKLADIFDMIERSGRRGVMPDVLLWVFYADRDTRRARFALTQNIKFINDRFAETDLRVRIECRFGPYRVMRIKQTKLASAA